MAGKANLRKREKTNGLIGLKTQGGVGQPKKKRKKMNGLVREKIGATQANLRKKEKTNGLVGAKNRGPGGPT